MTNCDDLAVHIFRLEVAFRGNCFKGYTLYLYEQKLLNLEFKAHFNLNSLFKTEFFMRAVDSFLMEENRDQLW